MNYSIELPVEVLFIIDQLEQCGFEAYVVGGCVRDSILGRTPKDWDITTSANPEEVISTFPYENILPTGLKHGTVTILLNDKPFEVTTYRIDGEYSDSRRPDKVEFTRNLVEDLKRRDFTINAMVYSHKTGLIDLYGGLNDIKYRIIRCVGSPEDRFDEDALRILRAFRLAAQLDFGINNKILEAATSLCTNLKNISMERINSEFCKMLTGNIKRLCNYMLYSPEIFWVFIPELKAMYKFKQNNPFHDKDVWHHTISALENTPNDLILRLAILFHDIGKPPCYSVDENSIGHFYGHGKVGADIADKIMRRLKFDNTTRYSVVELIVYHDSILPVTNKYVSTKYIKRWLNRIGEIQLRRLVEVKHADIKGQNQKYTKERLLSLDKLITTIEEVINTEQCFNLKDLKVNGRDLIQIGYRPGKQLGMILNGLLDYVITEECENQKEELLRLAKSWLKILMEVNKNDCL